MSASKPLKILMLHGFTQSGALFHAKTRALSKAIQKSFPGTTFSFPNGPLELLPIDIPGYIPPQGDESASQDAPPEIENFAWWRRKDDTTIYAGIEETFTTLAEVIKTDGPFDGVIGFSQGAACAAVFASLLEKGRVEAMRKAVAADSNNLSYPKAFLKKDSNEPIAAPLKFAICYSGFAAPSQFYSGFYEPKLTTPVLHVIGSLDTIVSEERSQALVDSCESGKDNIVTHPGGHFVPSTKDMLNAAVSFISQHVGDSTLDSTKPKQGKYDVSAEDMDLPF